MSTAEAYYREVKGLSVEETPILGREHHIVIELLEDYHRGMTQVKNNDLLHDVSHQRGLLESFRDWLNNTKTSNNNINNGDLDDFLEDYNCG